MSASEPQDNLSARTSRTAEEPRLTSSYLDGSANKPNLAECNGDGVAHEGSSREDSDDTKNLPTVVLHVRQNFGVLAPVIESFIFRGGYINCSLSDVYLSLSRKYAIIVDSAMKQVGYEKFMLQMQVMLTQILYPEFGADTEFLVNTILTYNNENTLFVSLLSRSVLSELVNYAQQMIQSNMFYNPADGATGSGGGGGGGGGGGRGMDNNSGGSNYYRGGGQQGGYRSGAGGNTMREHRGAIGNNHNTMNNSSNTSAAAQQDGMGTLRPYRSNDELRANSDIISHREDSNSREWGGMGPRRGSVGASGGADIAANPNPSSVDPNGAAAVAAACGGSVGNATNVSGMPPSNTSRTELSGSRPSSEVPAAAAVMPRHNHFINPHTSAAFAGTGAAPSAKTTSASERGIVAGMPQHHFLPQRISTTTTTSNTTAMAGQMPTLASASMSQNSTAAPVPSIMRAGGNGMMHTHLHANMQPQQQQPPMLNNGAGGKQNDWQGNTNGNMSPITPVAPQRTVTPPSPQHMQQQQQPSRVMSIPAPLSVQRRAEEKNAAAAAAAAAAAVKAAGAGNNSVSANSNTNNNASITSGNTTPLGNENASATPRSAPITAALASNPNLSTTTNPTTTSTVVPAPRGLQQGPPVHHVHHMLVTHHHHHHLRLSPPTATATGPAAPIPVTAASHSPSPPNVSTAAVEERTSSTGAATSPTTPAPATPTPPSAPAQPTQRGTSRFPSHHHHHHHHHHHSHLISGRTDVASAPVTPPPTQQPQSQRSLTSTEAREQQQPQPQPQPQPQQQERTNTPNGVWPNEKEELRGKLLSARVSEKAVTQLMTLDSSSIDELYSLKYTDFEKRLRPVVTVLLDRQRIYKMLNTLATQSRAGEPAAEAFAKFSQKSTSVSVGEEPRGGGQSIAAIVAAAVTNTSSRRPPSITVAVPSQSLPSPHSSPTSKSGVQVPQPRTKMQQQQQQQHNANGSPVASPTDASYASSELESSRRESSLKAGSPSGYANASSSSNFQPNSSTHNSSRPDEMEDSRDEEQRRGSGRRGGKRGSARGGGTYSNRVCKYYHTPEGCQYGDKCHYVHSGK